MIRLGSKLASFVGSKATLPLLFLLLAFTTLPSPFVDAGTNEAGLAFLAENRNKPGVVSLPSGLQYKVLTKGRGPAHPTIESPCSCHYEGRLLDGTVFDSSYDRGSPTSFAPNQVIKAWTEAMMLMVAGDKWELYIPSELGKSDASNGMVGIAPSRGNEHVVERPVSRLCVPHFCHRFEWTIGYGDRGSPPKIGGGEVLVFVMEMLAIAGDTVPALSCEVTDAGGSEDCTERELKYIAKARSWKGSNKAEKEVERLNAILGTPMSDELRDLARRRRHILAQFVNSESGKEL